MIRVFLFGMPGFVDESAQGLRHGPDVKAVGASHEVSEAAELVADLMPDVLVVDRELQGSLEAGSLLARQNPRVAVFLACDRPSVDLYRKAQAHGLRGLVRKPLDGRELVQAVEMARQEESRRSAGYEPRQVPAPRLDSQPMVARQEVIAVYSPKGGVGKTTIAVNLAACYLGGRLPLRPVVLDFDVQANVAALLQLRTPVSIADWMGLDRDVIDRQSVENLIVRHPAGLAVVPGLRLETEADALTAETASCAIETLRRYFDMVVVDTGPVLRDSTLVAFDLATKIFIVGKLDVPTLQAISKTAEVFGRLNTHTAKVRLVLNGVPKKPDLPVREVIDLLAFPLAAKIPEDPAVPVLGNRGEIVVLAKPESPFSQEVRRLAGGIAPVGAAARPGLLGRLFGRRKMQAVP